MNREIKFRAWDGNQMLHTGMRVVPEHLKHAYSKDYFTDIIVMHCRVETWFLETKISDEYFDHPTYLPYNKIMQFTGLSDKNGKDIFEGDIVKTPASKSVVEFDKGLFGLNHDYGTGNKTMLGAWGSECNLRCLYDGYHREVEVIGNIFENPELLS